MFALLRFSANLGRSGRGITRRLPLGSASRIILFAHISQSFSTSPAADLSFEKLLRLVSAMSEQDKTGEPGARTVNTSERLNALRLLLKENQVDA
jgi:hypothetical protein